MSELPKGWVVIPLEKQLEQVTTTRKKLKAKEYLVEGVYPVVDQGQGSIAGYSNDESLLISSPKPVVVFGDHTRVLKYVDFEFVPGADGTKVLVPNEYYEPKYFYYMLRALELPDKGYSRHFKYLKECKGKVAPLAEQTRIVEKLDEVLAQVDTIKARLDGIPAILKRFRQSVLASAVSGKLTEEFYTSQAVINDITEEWIRYQEETFRKLGKQNKSNTWMKKAPAPINRVEFSDRLPKGKRWCAFILDEIILAKNQGVNTTTEKVEYTSSGIVAVQAGNIQESKIDFQSNKFVSKDKFDALSCHVKPAFNDVLYTNIGANFGNAAVVPEILEDFLITWNVMRIVPSKILLPKYLELVLNSSLIRDIALTAVSTSTVPFVNGKTIGQYVIPTPPIEEQKEIVRLVDQYFAFADTIEAQVKKAQARVDNLTQSILAKAFRGELVAQDPNDEPADKLLERIAQARKEAEALAKATKKAEAAKKKVAKSV
ncbi:restriction endonuclease subunit S [Vibrio rotiferianus]|uniref:restriction endonuclease subunit S n=1 Tax=Vibrio rotiferianus TaxID=190895 RepID=UPI0039095219